MRNSSSQKRPLKAPYAAESKRWAYYRHHQLISVKSTRYLWRMQKCVDVLISWQILNMNIHRAYLTIWANLRDIKLRNQPKNSKSQILALPNHAGSNFPSSPKGPPCQRVSSIPFIGGKGRSVWLILGFVARSWRNACYYLSGIFSTALYMSSMWIR